jgi:hypothetical protein
MLKWLRKLFQQPATAPRNSIEARITDSAIAVVKDGTVVQSVAKTDIAAINIVTTNAGPWADDVFFCFQINDAEDLVVSMDTEGSEAVSEYIFDLEGLDEETFIQAMGSTSNQTFAVWKRA